MKLRCNTYNDTKYDYYRSTFTYQSFGTETNKKLKAWFEEFNQTQTKIIDLYYNFLNGTETFGTLKDLLTSPKLKELSEILKPRYMVAKITDLGFRSLDNKRMSMKHPFFQYRKKIINHKHLLLDAFTQLKKSNLFHVQAVDFIYCNNTIDINIEILDPRVWFLYSQYCTFEQSLEPHIMHDFEDSKLKLIKLDMDNNFYKLVKRYLYNFAENGDYTNWFENNDIAIKDFPCNTKM